MENQDKFSTFDRVLLAICLIVVLLCAFLMLDGRFLFSGDDTSKLFAVGTIDRSENDVRQKHQTGFTWRGSRNSDTVFEGDSIFTGDSSGAKIKFNKGGELKIDSKSLVVIRTNNGQLELDLLYGALSGDIGTEKIIIIKDGERTELTGKINLDQVHKPQKLVKGIALNLPSPNIAFWTGKINYSWDTQEAGPYIVEFSAGPSFKKKLAQIEVSENEYSAAPKFEISDRTNKKEIFWRVRSKEKPVVSEVRKITLYKDIAPLLDLPKSKQVNFVDPSNPETFKVEFTWTEPTASQNYNVQVAKDEGFKEVVVNQTTQEKHIEVSTLEQGEYFWRVQGNHPSRSNSPWSEARKLTLIDKSLVTSPKLSQSDKVYVLPLTRVVKQPSNLKYEQIGVPVSDFPSFAWSNVLGASSYELEVSKDKSFQSFATQVVTPPVSEFKFTVMKPGIMNWRVRSVLYDGEKTEPTAVSSVRVELPPPADKPVDAKKDYYNVSWAPMIFARFYEVQWSTDDQFASPTTFLVSGSSAKVEPTTAPRTSSLFWRVRALDQQKKPLSAYTKAISLRAVRKLAGDFGADPTIRRPYPREPRAQTSVVSFDQAPVFLNFKWSKVSAVETYRFELSRDPEFVEEPVFTKVVNETQLLINQRLPAGEYYWRVRGENADGSWTVWSEPSPFFVQFK